MVTSMLVTDVGDVLVTVLVTNIQNMSPTSKFSHQHTLITWKTVVLLQYSPKWSIIFSKWFNIYCRTISGLSVKNSEAKIWSQIRLASLTRRQLLYALLNENRKCRRVFNLNYNWVSTSKILIFTFRYHYSNLALNERRDLWDFFHKHIVAIELESNSLQHFQIVHLYLNKNCTWV